MDIKAGPLMMEGREPRERRGTGTAGRIDVIGNQIEPALKALKKQMLKDGTFQEMKRRAFYEKPSVKRKRKQRAGPQEAPQGHAPRERLGGRREEVVAARYNPAE